MDADGQVNEAIAKIERTARAAVESERLRFYRALTWVSAAMVVASALSSVVIALYG